MFCTVKIYVLFYKLQNTLNIKIIGFHHDYMIGCNMMILYDKITLYN